jgi:L-fuconolactonase
MRGDRTAPDAALLRVDPTDPDVVRDLPVLRRTSNVVGIRLSMTQGDWRATLRAADVGGFFAAAEEAGVRLSIYMPGGYPELADLAARYPELRIAVDHLALDRIGPPLDQAIEPVLELAAYPNVAVKASALPCFVDEAFPFPSIVRGVTHLVRRFGSDRVFWGSDLSRLPCTYGELISCFVDHMPALDDGELAELMGGAISRWLEWPTGPEAVDACHVSTTSREPTVRPSSLGHPR